MSEPSGSRTISVEVNGTTYEREVEARRLLVHGSGAAVTFILALVTALAAHHA